MKTNKICYLLVLVIAGWSLRAYGFGTLETGPENVPARAQCRANILIPQFTSSESRYSFRGDCAVYAAQTGSYAGTVNWSAVGTFNLASKATVEQISLLKARPRERPDNPPTYDEAARITTTMTCGRDPWREPDGHACRSINPQILGSLNDFFPNAAVSAVLASVYPTNTGVPRTSLLGAEDRTKIQKQYAIHANLQKTSSSSVTQLLGPPRIVSPLEKQKFLGGARVPIKLAPVFGIGVASYSVGIQHWDTKLNEWVIHPAINLTAADAQSPTGYTGFVPGVSGAWRLMARVSSPKQSDWSNWVEFSVTAPPAARPSINSAVKNFSK